MKWRIVPVVVASVALVGLLAACGTAAPTPTPTQTASAEEAASAPVPVPVVAVPQAPVETAPATTTAAEKPEPGGIWDTLKAAYIVQDPYFLRGGGQDLNVFNSLFQVKYPMNRAKGVEFEPYLATEFTTSEDGSKWRFKLRQGVTWHDGQVFNADDVVTTIRRTLDPDFLLDPVQRGTRNVIVEVKKIDDYTVEFDTGKPDATAFAYFSSPYMSIVPEHLIRGEDPTSSNVDKRWKRLGLNPGQSGTFAIGTGPFSVTESKIEVGMTLVKNPNYFKFDEEGRRLPYLDGLKYHEINDPIRKLAFFVSGKAEYSTGPGAGLNLRDATALCKQTRDPGCYLYEWEHGFGSILNNSKSTPIFQDPKVNVAHRYGHNVESPLKAYSGGSAWLWVNRQVWPDSTLNVKEQYELLPWSNPARRGEFDAKARQLLADAGYPNGVDLPFPFIADSGPSTCQGSFLDQHSRHADEINKIGFRTFLECRAGINLLDEQKAGRWSIIENYPSINLIDPGIGVIQNAVLTSGMVARLPYPWKGVDEADARYRVIQKTLDRTKQQELFKDFERYMANPELEHFVAYYARVYMSVLSCVHNYGPGGIFASNTYSLDRVWLTGDCRKSS